MNQITSMVCMQVFIMFALMVIGFILTKFNIMSRKGANDLSSILLMLVTPCVIISAYQTKLNVSMLIGLLEAFGISILMHLILIFISKILFRDKNNKEKNIMHRFASIYSNCGFMGIPLLQAALGSNGVFYGSAYLAVFNIFVWTHGIAMYASSKEKLNIKVVVANPGVIGVLIALMLYFAQIKLPFFLSSVVNNIANLNTPLAMILIGSFLARTNFLNIISNKSLYIVSIFRLLVAPAISIILFALFHINSAIATAVIISASCPSAAIVALFAEKHDFDSTYGSELVTISTLFSIITIPLVVYISGLIIK